MDAWLAASLQKQQLHVLVCFSNTDKLIGIAPFYIDCYRLFGTVSYCTLRMLGDSGSGAEYPSIIAKAGHEREICEAVVDELTKAKSLWDCIWLPSCASWDKTINLFVDTLRAENTINYNTRPTAFSAFELTSSYENYLAGFSSKRRNSLHRIENKMDKISGLEILSCQSEDEIDLYLATLYRLHLLRWSEKGETGAFAKSPITKRFYSEFAPLALRKGWLKFLMVVHNGEPKAIHIGYSYNGNYYQLQEGFDPTFDKGVGNYLRIKTIQRFIAEGLQHYDFLGGYTEHKRRWKSQRTEGFDLFAWNSKLRTLPFNIRPLWPTGRILNVRNH